MVHFISKLLEFLSSRVSYCTIFSSIPHFPTAAPPPIQGMSGDLSASVAPRGGAFVLADMTNPHLAPPSPVGGVVGHNIDRRITPRRLILHCCALLQNLVGNSYLRRSTALPLSS